MMKPAEQGRFQGGCEIDDKNLFPARFYDWYPFKILK
jgi:hypothetical protein